MGDHTGHWRDMFVMETATKRGWRAVERYLLPGKNTGFVVVCEQRACFLAIRNMTAPLGILPPGISPEDRKTVVAWAMKRRQFLWDDAFRHASAGTTPPHAFDPNYQEVSDG